jgi:dihydrofolate synthase / folylpolyglutamate synthase
LAAWKQKLLIWEHPAVHQHIKGWQILLENYGYRWKVCVERTTLAGNTGTTKGARMSYSYEEALSYMNGLMTFGWKLGNERFSALCAALGDPQDRSRVVHVTGTKGKGSTTALAAGILNSSGRKTGGYFSPYVFDVRERVQTSGKPITKRRFAEIVREVRPHLEAIAATELGQTTEFELKTLIGFMEFAYRRAEYACIEVGIGGRLDATNIVKPTACVITNIGLDHTQILGDTHELIAFEKAGIIKPGIPVVTACEHAGALEVIRNRAAEMSAPLSQVFDGQAHRPTGGPQMVTWEPIPDADGMVSLESGGLQIATHRAVYKIPRMALRGHYQRVNAACALAAVEEAVFRAEGTLLDPLAAAEGLAGTTLPGRFSVYKGADTPWIVMDGAHNALAAEALRAPLAEFRERHSIHNTAVVIGMLTGHDPEPVAQKLLHGAELAVVCAPDWKRAYAAQELYDRVQGIANHTEIARSVKAAVRRAIACSTPQDLVLISGSFYTVGECSPAWLRRTFSAHEAII